MAKVVGGEKAAVALRPNTRSNIEVAKPQTFNRETSKVLEFFIVYKLYITIKIGDMSVEKQIQ